MRRYAFFSAFHLVALLEWLVITPGSTYLSPVLLVISLPLIFAWGAFQADLALNWNIDDRSRNHWRIAFWVLPWSMAIYWCRHVRVEG